MSRRQQANMKAQLAIAAALLACAVALGALAAPTTSEPPAASNSSAEGDQCGAQDFFYWEGTDCTRFIKCKHGNITLHTCGKGKFWNHDKARCDGKQNVTGCAPDGSYLVDLTASPRAANMEAGDEQAEAEEARGGRHWNGGGGCRGRNCGGGGGGNGYNKWNNGGCQGGNCGGGCQGGNCGYNKWNNGGCQGGNCGGNNWGGGGYGRRGGGGRRNYGYQDQADGNGDEAAKDEAPDQAEAGHEAGEE